MKKTVSATHVKNKARRKTNPTLIETILTARKHKGWFQLAHILSGSTNTHLALNLSEIDSQTKAGDTVIITGKVLGSGNLTKKVRICALSASEEALEKIKKDKSEFVTILDEIKKNPKAEGVRIIK
ncbi:MAG: 50S ribosomal protein L18e [Nanoarchaeota archaeon]